MLSVSYPGKNAYSSGKTSVCLWGDASGAMFWPTVWGSPHIWKPWHNKQYHIVWEGEQLAQPEPEEYQHLPGAGAII